MINDKIRAFFLIICTFVCACGGNEPIKLIPEETMAPIKTRSAQGHGTSYENPLTGREEATIEPAEEAPEEEPPEEIVDDSYKFRFVPFNYMLFDDGGGWNFGIVQIAFENVSDVVANIRELDDFPNWTERYNFPEFILETQEGVTYPVEIVRNDTIVYPGRGGDQKAGYFDFERNGAYAPIPPGYRFYRNSSPDTGLNTPAYTLTWRSATAATPSRMVLQGYPALSFDLPSEQGSMIDFGFMRPIDDVQPLSSLNGKSVFDNPNEEVETVYTGRCGTPASFDATGSSAEQPHQSYLLEFSIKNNDKFYDQGVNGVSRMSLIRDDGFLYYNKTPYMYFDIAKEYDEIEGIRNSGDFFVTGPAYSGMGYQKIGIVEPTPLDGSYLAIWDGDSYTLYDLTACTSTMEALGGEN